MEGPTIIILQRGRVAPSEQLQTSEVKRIYIFGYFFKLFGWIFYIYFWEEFFGGIFGIFQTGIFVWNFLGNFLKNFWGNFFGGGFFLIFLGIIFIFKLFFEEGFLELLCGGFLCFDPFTVAGLF